MRQDHSGRRDLPHPPLGFSPALSRSTSTRDPSPPAQTPPPLSRGPTCPPTHQEMQQSPSRERRGQETEKRSWNLIKQG